jgi:hypothetical protein
MRALGLACVCDHASHLPGAASPCASRSPIVVFGNYLGNVWSFTSLTDLLLPSIPQLQQQSR